MAYEAECPKGHRLQVTEAHFNQQVNCPTCGESFLVPDLGAKQPAGNPHANTAALSSPAPLPPAGSAGRPFSLLVGRPMLAVGLLLVLVSRGCHAVGSRAVESAEQKKELALLRFNNELKEARLEIEERISEIDDKQRWRESQEDRLIEQSRRAEDPSERAKVEKELEDLQEDWKDDQQTEGEQRVELQRQLEELKDKQRISERVFTNGEYRKLDAAAKEAFAKKSIRAYWWEMLFLVSSLIFALGLLMVSWSAQGAERLVCLIMLAIIALSLYSIGIAWTPVPR